MNALSKPNLKMSWHNIHKKNPSVTFGNKLLNQHINNTNNGWIDYLFINIFSVRLGGD